jgi:multisubunit Na+/H+ antiporter MnhF subunit
MLAIAIHTALVTLGVALLIAVVRLVKGPTLPDRVVAMDLIGVLVVGLIALIGFVGTVAYATYVERGHPE